MDDTIRKAREADILAIAGIYDRILTKEETGGATIGWVRGVYPTESFANKALAAGDLFVLEDGGKICATARINQEQVPEYADGNWLYSDASDDEIMVLHTLVELPPPSNMTAYSQPSVSSFCASVSGVAASAVPSCEQ